MSTLGIFWICSIIVSYSLGIYLGKTLFKDTCVSYVEKYKPILIQGLRKNYPPMKEVTLVCATEEKAIEYKDKLLKKSTYDKV